MATTIYTAGLQAHYDRFEAALPAYLPTTGGLQDTVARAMAYACTDGGKRIRPVLTLEFCRLTGGNPDWALPFAAAIEMMRAQGRHVYAAALDESARQLGSFAFGKADSAVIGNEGHGLSEKVLHACDASVYIPMAGDAESLNASVAAAVLMWEMCRND